MNVEWYLIGILTGLLLFCGASASVAAYYYSHPQKAIRYLFNRNDKRADKKKVSA